MAILLYLRGINNVKMRPPQSHFHGKFINKNTTINFYRLAQHQFLCIEHNKIHTYVLVSCTTSSTLKCYTYLLVLETCDEVWKTSSVRHSPTYSAPPLDLPPTSNWYWLHMYIIMLSLSSDTFLTYSSTRARSLSWSSTISTVLLFGLRFMRT